jgi:hypothetical protein
MLLRRSLHTCILFLSATLALGAGGFKGDHSVDPYSQSQNELIENGANSVDLDFAMIGQAQSTSDRPPATRPFSGVATPVRDYPRVASSGRCAPLYKNGTRGTCIAEKACRGYGIRNDKNEVLCMCYLTHGGCDAKSRCDDRAHACVADTRSKKIEE